MLAKLLLQQGLIFDIASNDQFKNDYIIPKTDIVLCPLEDFNRYRTPYCVVKIPFTHKIVLIIVRL